MIKSLNKIYSRLKHTNICIIGGGLGGLSIASKLASKDCSLTIYDKHDPGCGGASSVAAGLLHPLTPKGNIIWMGDKGLQSTEKLILDVEQFSGQKIQHKDKEIIRPLHEDFQYERYRKSVLQHPEYLDLISSEEYSKLVPLAAPSKFGAVRIKGSSVIDTRLYLRLLWEYVQSLYKDAEWSRQVILNVDSVSKFHDLVIVSPGSSTAILWPALLPYLHLTVGYHLLYPDPGAASNNPLKYSLLSGEYMIPHPSIPNHLLCGATKESTSYHSPRKELSLAAIKPRLHPFLCQLYPSLSTVEPISTWGGVRTFIRRKPIPSENGERFTPPALPIIDRHPEHPHIWVMTGFGSRGLIHHSIAGDYLAQAIEANDLSVVPKELRLET